jgi:mannose-6-phosphate isomerase-like protein (cupin superfamily)
MAATISAPATPQPSERRIYNPVQRDAATFLETSEESGGERTLAELEVAPGGRVTPHYHLTYAEHFRAREGRLTVRVGDARHELEPGEEAVAPPGTLHAGRTRPPNASSPTSSCGRGTPASRRRCASATGSRPTGAFARTARRAIRCTSR